MNINVSQAVSNQAKVVATVLGFFAILSTGVVSAAEIDVTDALTFLEAERVTIGIVVAAVLTLPILGLIARTIGSIFHRA